MKVQGGFYLFICLFSFFLYITHFVFPNCMRLSFYREGDDREGDGQCRGGKTQTRVIVVIKAAWRENFNVFS